MIIPKSIRAILSGDVPISSSGRVSLSSAPDFTISGPTPELTEFFDGVTRHIGVRAVLPRLFSTLANGGIAHILVGYGCDDCGLGRMALQTRRCDHPNLLLEEAMIVNPMFTYRQLNISFLRSLDEIKGSLSYDGRRAVDEAIATGSDLVRLWSDLPARVEEGQLTTVAVPVGTAWGTEPTDMIFRNQMSAAAEWIGTICREVGRLRGMTLDNIGTLAGESPVPDPHIVWRC